MINNLLWDFFIKSLLFSGENVAPQHVDTVPLNNRNVYVMLKLCKNGKPVKWEELKTANVIFSLTS